MTQSLNNTECNALRWLGYFDLLGTSELIRSGKTFEVLTAYQDACEQLARWSTRHASVYHAWFSDTFIMYSDNDSLEAFSSIEMVCRWFVFALLRRRIPVRGAISCGQFYADRAKNLYVGAALLDAYEWGENQNWIGFILSPSTEKKFQGLDLPVEVRKDYVKYAVPFKMPPKHELGMVVAMHFGKHVPPEQRG